MESTAPEGTGGKTSRGLLESGDGKISKSLAVTWGHFYLPFRHLGEVTYCWGDRLGRFSAGPVGREPGRAGAAKAQDKQAHTTVASLRRYFVTGLIIVLPSALTLYIVWLLFSLVGGFLSPILGVVLRRIVGTEMAAPVATLLSVLVTAGLIILVGVTGTLFSQRIFQKAEVLFTRIPLVRGIYGSIRQLIDLVTAKDSAFHRVAMIEYPRQGIRSLCFVTSRRRYELPDRSDHVVTVFLPTSPNPTSGFFLLVPEREVTYLNISVDEAVKMIISGGMIGPDVQQLFPETSPVDYSPEEITY